MTDEATVRALMAIARAKTASAFAQLNKVDLFSQIVYEGRVLDALTTWFASKDAVGATELPRAVVDELVANGIKREIAEQVGEMVLAKPMTGRTRHGAPSPQDDMTAMRRVASEEPSMRAQFVLAACKRLSLAESSPAALRNERRYLDMHVAAGRGRRAAAKKVDAIHAPVLVWRTQEDAKVEARCAMLDHRLFTADNPPNGTYPGAVHPQCRCYAVAWTRPLFQP